ncbi:hypothetical protein [Streptomyces sp. NPDC048638]|uniref:hypothetical protein n=1 Tax=Streptomyces sp. NPDC048638 TaxID=3365580 RepID=UPI0037121525
MLIHLALEGERITGASEEGGIVTTADEKRDPFHVPLPPEAPVPGTAVDQGIPEWAPPLPTTAPPVPAQPRPASLPEPRRAGREGRGEDWWTKKADPANPWPAPDSLAPPEEPDETDDDEAAGHSHDLAMAVDEGGREHSHGVPAQEPERPVRVDKEPVDESGGRARVFEQVREEFAPLVAEVRALQDRFARPYEPSDDMQENAKRLRWMRIRRYGFPLGIALVPLPPTLPGVGAVVGGNSLAGMYASIPESLQVSSGWSPGWAAVAVLAPTSVAVVRFARHLKARRKPGFTLRIVVSAMVCGSVMYGPVGAYAIYIMNGHIA